MISFCVVRDQFQQLREMFDQSKESFDNAVEQLQKERNDNSEILQQHNVLKEENKNLRILIDQLNERLDGQDNKINATNVLNNDIMFAQLYSLYNDEINKNEQK